MLSTIGTFLLSSLGGVVARVAACGLALVVTFGVGFLEGDKHRAEVDNAAGAQAQIEFQKREIAARDESAAQDTAQADTDAANDASDTEKGNAIKNSISVGACFTDADVSSLRNLWTPKGNH